MAKYIFILLLATSCSLFSEMNSVTKKIDTSKDTSFIVDRGADGSSIILNIDGYLSDSALIVITYHESKGNENVEMTIPLDAGEVHLKNVRRDFYDNHAKITFKHFNNKKADLTIKASL